MQKINRKKIIKKTSCCPMCKGKGKIVKIQASPYTLQDRINARKLYKRGYTLRTIGAVLGIKNAQSVKSMMLAKNI